MQSPTQFHAIAVTYAFLRSQGFHRTCQQLLVDTLPLTKDVRVLPAHAAQASSLDQIISEYGRLKQQELHRQQVLAARRDVMGSAMVATIDGIQELLADYAALREVGWSEATPKGEQARLGATETGASFQAHSKHPVRHAETQPGDSRAILSDMVANGARKRKRARVTRGGQQLGKRAELPQAEATLGEPDTKSQHRRGNSMNARAVIEVSGESGEPGSLFVGEGPPGGLQLHRFGIESRGAASRSMSPGSMSPVSHGRGGTVYSDLADLLLDDVESGGLLGASGRGTEATFCDAEATRGSCNGDTHVSGTSAASHDFAVSAASQLGRTNSSADARRDQISPDALEMPTDARQQLLHGLQTNAGRLADLINSYRQRGRVSSVDSDSAPDLADQSRRRRQTK